mgnify:CR=1 FL=1
MVDGVEEVHRADPKEEKEGQSDEDVESEDALGYLGDARAEAIVGDTGRFGVEEL